MAVTISTHNGTAVHRGHNIRDERAIKNQEHIDRTGTHEIWKDETERNAYKRLFGKAQEEYNAKQTRADRIIKDYYKTVENDAKKHTAYEMIVSIGNSKGEMVDDDTGKEILSKFVDGWDERNPNLELIGAYYHADEEGVPHVHCDYIPVAHGYKRGMETQTGLVKALGEMGFEKKGKATAQIQWQARENKHLEKLCLERGVEVQHPTAERREHIATEEYKAIERSKRLQNENKELEAENTALDIENTVIEQNIEFAKEDLENTKERVRTTVEKGKKKSQQLDIIMRAIPVKQKELEKVTEQVETAKTSQEQYKQQVNMLCDQIVKLEEEYARKEKEQLEKIEKELERAEKAKEQLELDRERLADEVERLAILQALSQELNGETMPKMSKQLVGSGTIVQAPPERVEKAFEAFEAMKALDLMAVKNNRREKQLIELKKQHEEEYQEKLVTTRYDAQRQVAKERADERNQFRREKKELESKLEKAEYREKMVDKYMQQTGQAAKFEKWKVEQARRTVRNSIESLEEVAGFKQKKDYGLER